MARVVRIIVVVSAIAAVAWAAPTAAAATGHALAWPVDGALLKTFNNGDDPYAAGMHRGIDIAAPSGSMVRAAAGGEVSYAGRLPDGALDVTVRSADGRYLVSHMHLATIAVRRGDSVRAGARIGTVGSTGRPSSSQPHVHLGVRRADSRAYVDPLPLLPSRPSPMAPRSPRAGEQQAAQMPATAPAPAQHPTVRRPVRVRMRALADGGQVRERADSHRRSPTRAPTDTGAQPQLVADHRSRAPRDRSHGPASAGRAGRGIVAPGLGADRADQRRRATNERLDTGPATLSASREPRRPASPRDGAQFGEPATAGRVSATRIAALVAVAVFAALLLWQGRRPPSTLPRPTPAGRAVRPARETSGDSQHGSEVGC
jgi:hypothetical protein